MSSESTQQAADARIAARNKAKAFCADAPLLGRMLIDAANRERVSAAFLDVWVQDLAGDILQGFLKSAEDLLFLAAYVKQMDTLVLTNPKHPKTKLTCAMVSFRQRFPQVIG